MYNLEKIPIARLIRIVKYFLYVIEFVQILIQLCTKINTFVYIS